MHDEIDLPFLDLETLHILSSDIDVKMHVMIEVMCCFEVCHCFDDVEVNFQAVLSISAPQLVTHAGDDAAPEDLLKLARNNVERQTVIGLTAGIENLAIGLDEYHIKLQNVYYNKKQSMDGKKKVIYLKLLKTFQRVMAYLFIDGQKSLKDSKIVR